MCLVFLLAFVSTYCLDSRLKTRRHEGQSAADSGDCLRGCPEEERVL